ncbi:MAG: hypothetical protein JWM31_3683 [Solirubrobacterales bacterium]|nr:hypothetical protein [Solirubrobacterales bacterium]
MSERILTGRERLAARHLTGPLAHFVAGAQDWGLLLWRWARGRLPD